MKINFFLFSMFSAVIASATVRVEPKTFFANERTLLQWMNTAVLLSTISITLLNFGTPTGRLAGLIMAPVALFFIIYSFIVSYLFFYCTLFKVFLFSFCLDLFTTKLQFRKERTNKL